MRIMMQTQYEIDQAAAATARETERAAILVELDALDRRSARSLRAMVAGTATEEDKAKLSEIEDEAAALRARFVELEG